MKIEERPVEMVAVKRLPLCTCGDMLEAEPGVLASCPPKQRYRCPGCDAVFFGPPGLPDIEWREKP